MKQCRRCSEQSVDIIREQIVRRDPRSYLVCWYRCTACQDVSFSYRLFPRADRTDLEHEALDFDRGSSTSDEPPKTDTPLTV